MKKTIFTFLCMLVTGNMYAQIENLDEIQWRRVERDSLLMKIDSLLAKDYVPKLQPTDDQYRVVTNRFWDNWWVYGDIGVHTFRGDWSGNGKFKETLSPDFTVGIGKWFTPGFGIKGQFGMGNSRGFTEIWTPYAVGIENTPMVKADGTPYWKLKTKWWDINANVVFNISRILYAWEGYDSNERFNQLLLSLGIGGVHHYDKELKNKKWGKPYYGPKNEWYGNVELQYSRFFTKAKAWSLDVKLRGRFYETHYDLSPIAGHRWDYNLGVSIGATYYIKQRGWERCIPGDDINYFINVPAPVPVVQECPEYRTFTFYVFYPNNYSGRNDAPVVADADVHSMDYLAGGIFTQKKFKSNSAVASRLKSGVSLRSLKIENVPTEKATFTENPTGVARGYEMSSRPLSLEMDADDMQAFEDVAGYYYAPIYEADKTWCYRIDNETRTQTLLSRDNYKETTSYGLNAHAGLSTVRENMPLEEGTVLYSFADVYAALVGDEGYISQFSDRQAVDTIRDILENGQIIHVQAEGLATSQDNYTGENAEAVGQDRNRALSHYRAFSAIKWLRESGKFGELNHGDFSINVLSEPIGRVDDKSTRGLKAKLNRCARITIKYIK
ncbi:hypothetical protein AB9N12_10895 [Bacteroides sp. AN502(2024)]|uniref:hypothetical protein n=1 Tax=Bacteroides sp. AN502(2024) TaxID=3160599 RepID=UPI003511C265